MRVLAYLSVLCVKIKKYAMIYILSMDSMVLTWILIGNNNSGILDMLKDFALGVCPLTGKEIV